MICKDRYVPGRTGRYNDYFWYNLSDRHLQFMDYQNIRDYKHVYYLHGALFLFKRAPPDALWQVDVKLRTNDAAELLDAIAREIRSGSIPLFVSEGTSEEKQRAIAGSDHLHFAHAHLKEPRARLVIYGISLGDQDAHIADAVRRGTKRAAVSVRVGNKTANTLEREMHLFGAALAGVELVFFDSSSLFT